MDDMISRQAALDALNGIKISRNASWYEFYQKAITAVGELPSAHPDFDAYCDRLYKSAYERGKRDAQPGWIPTSERIPDNDRAVLVTLKWAEDDYEVAVGEYWHNSTASHGWGSFEGHVIAWHELPKPYWEGGQDGKN